MTFTSTAVLLFLVMDPLGNVPSFVSTLALVAPERRRRVLLRELLIALAALMGFALFFGRQVVGFWVCAMRASPSPAASCSSPSPCACSSPGAPRDAHELSGEPLLVNGPG